MYIFFYRCILCVVNMLSALCDVWELTRFTGTLICMNNCPRKRWQEQAFDEIPPFSRAACLSSSTNLFQIVRFLAWTSKTGRLLLFSSRIRAFKSTTSCHFKVLNSCFCNSYTFWGDFLCKSCKFLLFLKLFQFQ